MIYVRPELVHPFASAIDSDLVEPEEMVCVFQLIQASANLFSQLYRWLSRRTRSQITSGYQRGRRNRTRTMARCPLKDGTRSMAFGSSEREGQPSDESH